MRPPAPAPPRACGRKFFSVGTEFYFRACAIPAAHVRNFRAAGRRIIGSFCLILPGARAAWRGGHRAHRVFCFPVRLEGAHIARSGTLCRESAARRRLQPAMVAKSPDARHWGKLCGLLQKASKEKAMCALCPPPRPASGCHPRPSAASAGNKTEARSKRQEIIRANLRNLRETICNLKFEI